MHQKQGIVHLSTYMKRLFTYTFLLGLVVFLLASCNRGGGNSQYKAKSTAIGPMYQVNIIADSSILNGPIGDSLDYYYGGPYMILPQPESRFSVRPLDVKAVKADPYKKNLKFYLVVADVSEDNLGRKFLVDELGKEVLLEESGNRIARDHWAYNQYIVYLFANGEKNLSELIRKSYPRISQEIKDFYKKNVEATVYIAGEDNHLKMGIRDTFGIDIRLPSPFKMAFKSDSLFWLRYDSQKSIDNILIFKEPYTNKEQLTPEYFKAFINRAGQLISTDSEGSFMQVNDVHLPFLVQQENLDNHYQLIGRGIWEINTDFMGGPFNARFFLNENKNEVVLVLGFIHAPQSKKRDLMVKMEHVLNTIRVGE